MDIFILSLVKIFQPVTSLVISIVLPLFMTKISHQLIKLFRVTDEVKRLEIESMLRKALHECAANALKFSMTNLKVSDITPEVISMAVDYVRSRNPETIMQLKADTPALEEIILSKASS